jgi:hypothetical protein
VGFAAKESTAPPLSGSGDTHTGSTDRSGINTNGSRSCPSSPTLKSSDSIANNTEARSMAEADGSVKTKTKSKAKVGAARDTYIKSSWREVARHVPGRNDVKCREKWCNVLDPMLLHNTPFSAAEDALLEAAVSAVGVGKWSRVANYRRPALQGGGLGTEVAAQASTVVVVEELCGRTDAMCKYRWKQLHPVDMVCHRRKVREIRQVLPGRFGRRGDSARPLLAYGGFSTTVNTGSLEA